jgi:hypothetical protein
MLIIWIPVTCFLGILWKTIFLSKGKIRKHLELYKQAKVGGSAIHPMLFMINRLAWFASLSLGFTTTFLVLIALEDVYRFGFRNDMVLAWPLIICSFGIVYKAVFLSKDNIKSQLEWYEQARDGSEVIHPPATETEYEQPKYYTPKEDDELSKGYFKQHLIHQESDEYEEPKQEVVKTAAATAVKAEKVVQKVQKPQEPNFLQRFFAENLLAKIGGILLFLGVLFLLQLVYTSIGPVGKILIGFAVGFTVYGIGVLLDTKRLQKEARVMLGTGILINYLVILAGRYLIGDTFTDSGLLSEGVTFVLLICNTAFSVLTSLFYGSRVLLQFSFVFAYLVPFLLGAKASETPITLVGYSLIVSLAAVVLHYFEGKKTEAADLLAIAMVGGNILILLAPFASSVEWLIKLSGAIVLSLVIINAAFKGGQTKQLGGYFFAAYLTVMLLLLGGDSYLDNFSGEIFTSFSIALSLLALFAVGIVIFLSNSLISIFYLLFSPILIIVVMVMAGVIGGALIPFFLLGSLLAYLGAFVLVAKKIATALQYFFWAVLGVFVFAAGGLTELIDFGNTAPAPFHYFETAGVITAALLFAAAACYFSFRKQLSYLYSAGIIFGVLSLLPVLSVTGNTATISAIAIIALVALSIAMPFLNKNLLQADIRNVIGGLLVGALFGTGEIYLFGSEYFPGITLGLAFMAFAMLYFALSYLLYGSAIAQQSTAKNSNEQAAPYEDMLYSLLGISISLFSLAIAFVFSRHGEVVSAVWLFEASILFFFYQKTRDHKVFFAAAILMLIGMIKLSTILPLFERYDFVALIPLAVIGASLFANLKFLAFQKQTDIRGIHDVLHIISILLLSGALYQIIPSHQYGFAAFGITIALCVLAYLYSIIFNGFIINVFVAAFILFLIGHFFAVDYFFGRLESADLTHLKPLQYLTSILLLLPYFFLQKSENGKFKPLLFCSLALYLFLVSTYYVYNLFAENVFIITMYWGALAFAFSTYGIQKDVVKSRTVGLYILSLTVLKILIYDVWYGFDDAVTRILALILVGGLMIALSVLYSKKYGDGLKGEFSPDNFKK